MAAIERISLRRQVLEEVRQLILEGRLASGSRIREGELAAEIGVSRTPVREALNSLEREGQVFSDPGKGFTVSELSANEAQELYPLRALLEPLALRLSGLPDDQTLTDLRDLNESMTTVTSGPAWIDTDDRWHDLLVEEVPQSASASHDRQFATPHSPIRIRLSGRQEGRHGRLHGSARGDLVLSRSW